METQMGCGSGAPIAPVNQIIFQAGDIWPTLAEVIEEKLVDLLVLGTHGRTGLEKVLLGSVAEEIFRQALCPVLTVGPHSSLRPKNAAELNRILYATDFSPESPAAAPIAVSLAREHRAQLILLHSMEGTGEVSVLRHALRDLVPFGADLRCQPECVVERGAPANKILEVSEGHGADIIVLGVHGADGHLARITHFVNSDAYKIVTQAKCTVLTVRG
jgi:nucleotide-binding universal stress UspA family protein